MRMKNKCRFLLLSVALSISSYAQNYNEKDLLSFFEEIDVPFFVTERSSYNETRIPYEIALKHFFNNDENNMSYEDIGVSMEDDSEIFRIKRTKEIVPYFYYKAENEIYVIYDMVDGNIDESIRVSMLDDNYCISDYLVLFSSDEFELQTTISKIYGEIIYIFEYNSLMPYELDGSGNVTRINIKAYIIDQETNKFTLTREDVIYSKTEKYLFSKYKEVPDSIKAQDPFYKY